MNLSKELVKDGFEVEWVGMRMPNTKKVEVNEDGVTLRRITVPFNQRRLFCFMPKLLDIVKDADVVQWNGFVSAITGGFISKLKNKACVGLSHEMFVDKWKKLTNNKIEQIVYPEIEKIIAKNPYDAWIVPCDYTKNTLISLGVSSEIIKKIPHGIDHELFHPMYGLFREKYELWDRFVILYCGRFGFSGTCYSKNQKVLFDAFKKVKERIPNSTLLMVGMDFDKVSPYIQSLGLEIGRDVIYDGKIPKEDLPIFYSSGDVFVSSSKSEGFGFTLVEAQACGTPIVAFPNGSIPEVVANNKSGKLVKRQTDSGLAKGIEELYKYPQLRRKMSTFGLNWVKQFNWRKSAKEHEKLYEDVYIWHKINKG